MENKVNPVPVPPDTPPRQSQAQPAPHEESVAISAPRYTPPPSADMRLVIEPHGSSYVYKTIDRRTGEVISQYPMEEVLKMAGDQSYRAGVVISTAA